MAGEPELALTPELLAEWRAAVAAAVREELARLLPAQPAPCFHYHFTLPAPQPAWNPAYWWPPIVPPTITCLVTGVC